MKLVMDLESPQLGAVPSASLFPGLCHLLAAESALTGLLSFLDDANRRWMPLIHEALARSLGDGAASNAMRTEMNATMLKYRLCDYPAHPLCSRTNRCSAHTDYGTATLIFEDGVPGLQLQLPEDEQWRDVGAGESGDALVLFGWSAAVRSNGRIAAPLHRVVTAPTPGCELVPRRTSLVLFAAPPPAANLDPAWAHPDEPPKFRKGTAGTWRTQARRAHQRA